MLSCDRLFSEYGFRTAILCRPILREAEAVAAQGRLQLGHDVVGEDSAAVYLGVRLGQPSVHGCMASRQGQPSGPDQLVRCDRCRPGSTFCWSDWRSEGEQTSALLPRSLRVIVAQS